MSFRSKTLSLQRAYFNDGFNSTLEEVLRNAFTRLPSAKDRIVDIDLISSQLFASIENARNGEGIFVRVLEFERGAIGVINFETTDNSATIEEFFHPKEQDFLKDQIVFYVVRNNIVACNAKNKQGIFATNFLQIAQKAEVLGGDVRLRISDLPDETTLARLVEFGVKQVDFSINSFMQNLVMSTRPSLMQMIFGMADDRDVRKRANSVGRMVLKSGKFQKEEINKDQWLTNIGQELMIGEHSETFTIILGDGSKVSNSKLRKSRSVRLPRSASSFSFDHAKMELESYYLELKNDLTLGT